MRWTWWLLLVGGVFNIGCAKRMALIAHDDGPADQWSRGVVLYSNHCAGCHGEEGQGDGDDRPAIAGPGAFPREAPAGRDRTVVFDDARDLFRYVQATMPPLDVGSLRDDEIYALLNYMLKQAEIKAPAEVTAKNVAGIKLR